MSDPVKTMILEANYLSRFRLAWKDGQGAPAVVLPTPPTVKSQSLLAFLIFNRGQSHSREKLMDMFWGDSPPRKARRSLSTALWHIRQCFLDYDFLDADSQSIQFSFTGLIELDAEIFEKKARLGTSSDLQDAIALYQGGFLDGFYNDWVIRERFRLESLLIDALSRLMVLQEKAGDFSNARASGQQLMEIDSLHEDAHRLLMRVFCATGQRNLALEQYHLCRQILQDELNVEPMAETTQLYQAIHTDQYEIGSVPPVVLEPISLKSNSTGSNPLDILNREILVGRDQELALLNEQWESAQSGQGSLIMVNGEPGVGKTCLLEKFTDHLRSQGKRVLWGRCYEFERQLPYQPFAEALRPALLELSPKETGGVPDWVLRAMGRLVPEMLVNKAGDTPGKSNGVHQEQAHLFAGAATFLKTISASDPMLLVLEDLHWATESTLELVHYLTRHLTSSPLLIIGSYRSDIVGERNIP